MLMSNDVDAILGLARELLHSRSGPGLPKTLLERMGSLIGADMAAFREVYMTDTEPRIGRHASSGVPDHLHNQYLDEFYRFDPAISPRRMARDASSISSVAEVSRYDASSYAAFPCPTETHERYLRDFLTANRLLNSISLHIRDGRHSRLYLLDFHRPSSATAFSERELVMAQMICPTIQLLCMDLASTSAEEPETSNERRLFEFGFPDVIRQSQPARLPDDQWVKELTSRERQVVLAVMRGCSNKELARQLSISVRTAENHLRTIYRKCDVHSRTQLTSKLMGMAG